jgi:hypothetical protein
MTSLSKKRGRPVGSKNKSKLTEREKELGRQAMEVSKAMGILPTNVRRLRKKPAAKVKTFKQSESAAVQRLMKDNLQLIQDNKQLLFKIQLLEHKIIGFRAVVSYLEVQAGFKVTQ